MTTCLARYSLNVDSYRNNEICGLILGLPHSRELLAGSVNLVKSPMTEAMVM